MGLSLLFCNCGRGTLHLFELLNPDKCGVHFTNNLSESDSLNILNYVYYYNGGGVGIADFNNDGLEDIFFSGNETSCQLYLNKGEMKFEERSQQASVQTTQWCTGVAIADVNSDGWMDIYVCAAGHPEPERRKNLLFINQGIQDTDTKVPTFRESAAAYGLADTAYSTQAAFLDFDLDGDLDLYVMNHANERESVNTPLPKKRNGEGSSSDHLYRNNGDRSFSDVSRETGILLEGYGLGIAVTDINRDGWPDIYIANDFIYNDILYINEGGKHFKNQITQYFQHQTYNSMGCDFADYNNDQCPDLFVADMLPETDFEQKMMAGAMTWDKSQLIQQAGYEPQYVRNTLQLAPTMAGQTAPASFREIGQLAGVAASDWSWAPLFADFDNDGWKDLFISNGYLRDITNKDFINYSKNLSMFKIPREADRQLLPKIRELEGKKLPNRVFKNNRDLRFLPKSSDWGLTHASCSNGAAYADLDSDGDLDLVVNNLNQPAFIYENKADKLLKNNYLNIRLEGFSENKTGAGAVVTACYAGEKQCLVQYPTRGFMSSVSPTLHFGFGHINTIDSLLLQWSNGKRQVLLNVPINRTITLRQSEALLFSAAADSTPPPNLAASKQAAGLSFEHHAPVFYDFQYQPLLPHGFSENGPPMAVGDLNGDQLDDCYVGGGSGQSGQLFYQRADGTFYSQELPKDLDAEDCDALLFDANNDGALDLYVVSGSNRWPTSSPHYQDRLYLNDGKGNLMHSPEALPEMHNPGNCVAAADFDRDGDQDLFVGGSAAPQNYPMPAHSYLLRNDGGKFTDITETVSLNGSGNNSTFTFPGIVNDLEWADLNQDGYTDLIMLGEWMPVTVLLNTGNGFSDATASMDLHQSSGWWNCLKINDIDNDGDLDIIAGNLGLNSRYQTSEKHPLSIYANDFDKNGALDAVTCRFIDGKEKPVQQRDELLAQINGLSKKYIRYAQYASASIQEVFGAESLSNSYFRDCKNLESVCFINQFGRFSKKQLPLEVQTAPVNAILCCDINLDSKTDLLMTGNSNAFNIATGHLDASSGWLLMGDGTGNFYPLTSAESGFSVQGIGKSIALLTKRSGQKQVLVGRHNNSLQVFDIQELRTLK